MAGGALRGAPTLYPRRGLYRARLVGPTGCGKSTFARQHFKPTEVLSSDCCRGLVSDDENGRRPLTRLLGR
jgi:hypothetical protein